MLTRKQRREQRRTAQLHAPKGAIAFHLLPADELPLSEVRRQLFGDDWVHEDWTHDSSESGIVRALRDKMRQGHLLTESEYHVLEAEVTRLEMAPRKHPHPPLSITTPKKLAPAEYDRPMSCHAVGLLRASADEGRRPWLAPQEKERAAVSWRALEQEQDEQRLSSQRAQLRVRGPAGSSGFHLGMSCGDSHVETGLGDFFARCFKGQQQEEEQALGSPPKAQQQEEGEALLHRTPHGYMTERERRSELDRLRAVYEQKVQQLGSYSSTPSQMSTAERLRTRSRLTATPYRERKGAVYA